MEETTATTIAIIKYASLRDEVVRRFNSVPVDSDQQQWQAKRVTAHMR